MTQVASEVMMPINIKSISNGINLLLAENSIDKTNTHLIPFFCNNGGTPHNEKEYKMVTFPVGVPLPGKCQVKTGPVNQNTYDSDEEVDTAFLPFWITTIKKWNQALQETLLNEDSLKNSVQKYRQLATTTQHHHI